jgi:aryl-alcohol dehydrogenase-like predicted oxidoreductase
MEKTPLGASGEVVSVLCLGTMHFGTVIDKATSYGISDHHVEAGGAFLDTANNYATWVEEGVGGESGSTSTMRIAMRGTHRSKRAWRPFTGSSRAARCAIHVELGGV